MIATIKNEALSVGADTLGAELQWIKSANGIDYLWDGNPEYWNGRAPILFPFVGSLRNGRAASALGDIVLPIHGFARTSEWELEHSETQTIVFRLCSDESTKKGYPYDFEIRVIYTLVKNSVTTKIKIKNTGKHNMPFCVGGHPGFNVPLIDGESFTDYIIEFEKAEIADCPFVDLEKGIILTERRRVLEHQKSFNLAHNLFYNDALIFDNLLSRRVSLLSKKSGHGVMMDFHSMDYFAVWSPIKHSPFVCLEPWTGMATLQSEDNIFEHKLGMRLLAPGEEDSVSFTVTVF